jgi:phosphoribosylformylglycinamidine synthase
MKAIVRVTLRKSILDPQGKATHHALGSLGFDSIRSVRIGKYIELEIDSDDQARVKELAERACEKLLANPVMEDYEVTVVPEEITA